MRSFRVVLLLLALLAVFFLVAGSVSATHQPVTVNSDAVNPAHKWDAIELQDGRIIACFGTKPATSERTVVAISDDGGETWVPDEKVIAQATGTNLVGCDLTQTPDGTILLATFGDLYSSADGNFWSGHSTGLGGVNSGEHSIYVVNETYWGLVVVTSGECKFVETQDGGDTFSSPVTVGNCGSGTTLARTSAGTWGIAIQTVVATSVDGITWDITGLPFGVNAQYIQEQGTDSFFVIGTAPGIKTGASDVVSCSFGAGFPEDCTPSIMHVSDEGETPVHVWSEPTGITTWGGAAGWYAVDGSGPAHLIQASLPRGWPVRVDGEAALFSGSSLFLGAEGVVEISVNQLGGFDVDDTGTTAIARLDGGVNVTTYSAGTLSGGNVVDTNCGILHGVAALANHVSYFHCDPADSGDITQLRIRSSTLGSPTKPPVCSGTGFCVSDIDDEEIEGSQDIQSEISEMYEFPFDYSENNDGIGARDTVHMAWAVSQDDGSAGVMTYTMVNNGDDKSDFDSMIVDPAGNTPDQICVTQDDDGQTYLYAVSQSSNVKGARVDFSLKRDLSVAGLPVLKVDLTEVFSGTTSTAGAKGVGCGEGRFAIYNDEKVTLWNRNGTQPYATYNLPSGHIGTAAGIHMSADGKWVAFKEGSQVNVIATTDEFHDIGEVVFSSTLPDGFYKQMRLQGSGSSLWAATSSKIKVWGSLFQATTGNDTAYNPAFKPPTSGGSGGSGTEAPACANGSSFLGGTLCGGVDANGDGVAEISGSTLAWFVGVLFVVALAIGGGAVWPPATAIGGSVGVLAAVGFGLWPLWSVALIGLIVVGTVVIYVSRRT